MGRFMRPDPIMFSKQKVVDPQQWNMYAYARNNPLRFLDPNGKYVTVCQTDDKACKKAAKDFEKQRQKDLKSKKEDVRNAAKAFGDQCEANGVVVIFKSQQQVDADAGNTDPTNHVGGFVLPRQNSDHKPSIFAEFSEGQSAKQMQQNIAHEGTHVGDAMQFLKSYDAATGKFNSALNYTHFYTELYAYMAGDHVQPYGFLQGPGDLDRRIADFLRTNPLYMPTYDILAFDPSVYPQ
jgi:hypothetical protein